MFKNIDTVLKIFSLNSTLYFHNNAGVLVNRINFTFSFFWLIFSILKFGDHEKYEPQRSFSVAPREGSRACMLEINPYMFLKQDRSSLKSTITLLKD